MTLETEFREPGERQCVSLPMVKTRPSASEHPSDGRGAQFTSASQYPLSPPAVGPVFVDERAQLSNDDHMYVSPLFDEIIQLVRMRRRWLRAKNSLILQAKAICRGWTEGDKPKADALFKRASKGDEGVDVPVTIALMPFLAAIERFGAELKPIEKRLQKLAADLPVFGWTGKVKGFGALNLAVIVGEAGNIGSYRNPSCLWMRFGLGVLDGQRQRRTTNKELAIAMGYAPLRRCVAYLLGDCLIKGNKDGEYRALYLARKEVEAARTNSKMHAHSRAARYMTKRVLRDLWIEWRARDPSRQRETSCPPPNAKTAEQNSSSTRTGPTAALSGTAASAN